MKTVYFLQGLPGSGKTTWALDMVKKSQGSIVRVNKDELRATLHAGEHSKGREEQILETRDFIIISSLRAGKHVIVDDTNFHPKHLNKVREIARAYGAKLEVKLFDVPLEECIARDIKRAKPVGAVVIRDMYNKYLRKDELVVAEYDPKLPDAIICDLDGTLCLLNGRDPYDATNCHDDLPNNPIVKVLERFRTTHKILYVTGRESRYDRPTVAWINYHLKDEQPSIFMRETGDHRKDSLIKQEIYDTYIKGKFNVLFVLDDRLSVCRMWHKNGLTLLRVGDPDADF